MGIKRSIAALLFAAALTAGASQGWLTDFDEAKEEAAKTNRPILVDFSGSDWCDWCIRLDKEVLSKEAFKKYASENLVLLLADFPRSKKVPAKVKAQNKELARKYGVRGFPTVLLLDKDGKILGKTGYRRGGPAEYVKHLQGLISKGKK